MDKFTLYEEVAYNDCCLKLMDEKKYAIEKDNIWELNNLCNYKNLFGFNWKYPTKYKPNKEGNCLKERLIVKG